MARGPPTFRQRDVTAAVRAVVAAGVEIARIKITKDGSIEIDTKSEITTSDKSEINEWDGAP